MYCKNSILENDNQKRKTVDRSQLHGIWTALVTEATVLQKRKKNKENDNKYDT